MLNHDFLIIITLELFQIRSREIIHVLSGVRKGSGQNTSRSLQVFVPKGHEWGTLPRASDNRESDLVAALSAALCPASTTFLKVGNRSDRT